LRQRGRDPLGRLGGTHRKKFTHFGNERLSGFSNRCRIDLPIRGSKGEDPDAQRCQGVPQALSFVGMATQFGKHLRVANFQREHQGRRCGRRAATCPF
jgi:hypothetical protein